MTGPLDSHKTDLIIELKESHTKSFRFLKQICLSKFSRIIKLSVITPIPYTVKPGFLLASFCVVIEIGAIEISGKKLYFYEKVSGYIYK